MSRCGESADDDQITHRPICALSVVCLYYSCALSALVCCLSGLTFFRRTQNHIKSDGVMGDDTITGRGLIEMIPPEACLDKPEAVDRFNETKAYDGIITL